MLSEEVRAALITVALAIDTASLPELSLALEALGCGADCGPLLGTQRMLHRAARDSSPEVVAALLAAGAAIDLRVPPLGWTPLLTALHAARPENARVLVESGADTTLAGIDGASAPFMAELLGLGALIPYPPVEMTQEEADRILLLAIEADDLQALRIALSAGADPRTTASANGWSALMIAAFNGHFEIAMALLDEGAGTAAEQLSYAEPANGMNALHAALLGARPEAPLTHVCTLAVLLHRGIDAATQTREGLTAREIAVNTGTFSVLADAAPPAEVEAACIARLGRNDRTADAAGPGSAVTVAVIESPMDDSAQSPAEAPPPAVFSGSQEELVRAFQSALDLHACRPGAIDGDFGPATERAARLYDMVRPADCSPLAPLPPIRRAEATAEWRADAIASLQALQLCRPATACGGAPGPDFYREHVQGCWYRSRDVLPDEYASWDGACDSEDRITGRGTLTYRYPGGAPGNHVLRTTLTMEAGRPGDGPVNTVLLNGSTLTFFYADGQRHGAYREVTSDGIDFTGNYTQGQRSGTWTQLGPGSRRADIDYAHGEAVRGTIRYSDGSTYRGSFGASGQADGFGELVSADRNTTRAGRWRDGALSGRVFRTTRRADGSVRTVCEEWANSQWQADVPGASSEACFNPLGLRLPGASPLR